MSEDTKSRLPIWLIVSLMANALLIGLIIGGGLGQRKCERALKSLKQTFTTDPNADHSEAIAKARQAAEQ